MRKAGKSPPLALRQEGGSGLPFSRKGAYVLSKTKFEKSASPITNFTSRTKICEKLALMTANNSGKQSGAMESMRLLVV